MEGVTIPQNEEIENIVLAIIAYNEGAISDVIVGLKPEYFYSAKNREIYRWIVKLFNGGKIINQATIASNDTLDREYIENLVKFNRPARDLQSYVDLLENLYIKRNLIRLGSDIVSLGMESETISGEELINQTSSLIFRALDIGAKSRTRSLEDISKEAMEELDKRIESDEFPGLRTHFQVLDYFTGGLHGGDEIIIAGRPSVGKTALMLKLVLNIAKDGKHVVIFSYEMPDVSLFNRLLSMESGVNLQCFRTGRMLPLQRQQVEQANNRIKNLPIKINDGVTGGVSYIVSETRALALQGKLDLVCVDYIQQMPIGSSNRNVEFGYITKTLKNLAKELKIPVIALSQLNRAVEGREDHRPILSDLRESGNIEQDADIVTFVYRDELYNPGESAGDAELIISKHRNGPLGTVYMRFDAESVNFKDEETFNLRDAKNNSTQGQNQNGFTSQTSSPAQTGGME